MKLFGTPVILLLFISCNEKYSANLYFNAEQPSKGRASLFANGIISTHLNEYNITFSPGGNVVLFTIANNTAANRFYTIFITKKEKGKWTKPQIAQFSGQFSDADPFFDPHSDKLYFISTRPVVPGMLKLDFDIWCVEYKDGDFSLPKHLGREINSDKDELYPAISKKGNLYFSTEHGENGYDIMVSKYNNGKFLQRVGLDGFLNTKNIEFDAFVDPDEKYIIYTGMGYKDSYGSGDLYISYKKDDYWTHGTNMGKKINSVHMDQCPMVSPDGNYLFFTSFRDSQPYDDKEPMTTKIYLDILNSPFNGLGNIFWIDFQKFSD
ncbi:TolB-like translocation protein [Chryseobacterium phocaeense]|uniref:PD40 domain-containing protein n=1 Tax=Chryseobacterium phocaeense TaxID=1816690 RepID=UPI0009BAE962|nr:PD40 domain-containing protein [Chryseobacterium phocaeense]